MASETRRQARGAMIGDGHDRRRMADKRLTSVMRNDSLRVSVGCYVKDTHTQNTTQAHLSTRRNIPIIPHALLWLQTDTFSVCVCVCENG